MDERLAVALKKQGITRPEAVPISRLRVTPVLPAGRVSLDEEELRASFYVKIWRTLDAGVKEGEVYQVCVARPFL